MKFQLYSFGESGHSYKVALALHFSKANWEQIFIDFFRGEARSEAYKNEINRMAEVPVNELKSLINFSYPLLDPSITIWGLQV